MRRLLIFKFALFGFLIPAVAQTKPTLTKKIVYKTVGDVKLSLHVFEPAGHKPTDSRPAVVFFFGGGWYGGSPSYK